jgi:hypothetical protein
LEVATRAHIGPQQDGYLPDWNNDASSLYMLEQATCESGKTIIFSTNAQPDDGLGGTHEEAQFS